MAIKRVWHGWTTPENAEVYRRVLLGEVLFQGEDYERCYVPDAAQKVLKRWDLRSAHYEVLETREYT